MKQKITLKSTLGLHASLASKVVQLSTQYDAMVFIEYDDMRIDAKSLLGLLSLAIPSGENLEIITDGNDAEVVMNEIKKLLG